MDFYISNILKKAHLVKCFYILKKNTIIKVNYFYDSIVKHLFIINKQNMIF